VDEVQKAHPEACPDARKRCLAEWAGRCPDCLAYHVLAQMARDRWADHDETAAHAVAPLLELYHLALHLALVRSWVVLAHACHLYRDDALSQIAAPHDFCLLQHHPDHQLMPFELG